MLTPTGRAFLFVGVLFVGLGALFGNVAYLAAGAFPALLVVASLAERPRATRLAARRTVPSTRPRRGDLVEVRIEVDLPRGLGHVEVWQKLPLEVELAEGTNLRVFALGRKPRTERFRFSFRATKRGPAELAPVAVEWHDPLGLAHARPVALGAPAAIEVMPRLPHLRRVPNVRAPASRFVPEGDPAPIGPPGTDFHEIREYHWGDPPKTINWKATARRLTRGRPGVPLVNEYEKEGRKSVWIFLDASGAMEVGTNIETALEHALEAAGATAAHYLDRGYAVGFTAFNASSDEILFPDHGRRQLRNILKHIAGLEPGRDEGLTAAVDRARRYFRGGRPMAIVLTRLAEPADATLDGVQRLVNACRGANGRGKAPVFVVDTRPQTPLENDETPEFLDALDAPLAAACRARGARVVTWRPGKERFESAFVLGLRRAGGARAKGVAR